MSFASRFAKLGEGLKGLTMGAAHVTGNVANKIGKAGIKMGSKVNNAAAGGVLGIVEEVAENGAKETIKKGVGKAGNVVKGLSKTFLSDDDSYFRIGKAQFSPKRLFLDDAQRRVKSTGDFLAFSFEGAKKTGIIKHAPDSLFNYQLGALGKTVAAVGVLAAGVPGAAKSYVEDRRGYAGDQFPTSSSPRLPAYAENSGATGDLVFALNNLRHGGMM